MWRRGRKTWPVSASFSVLQVGQLPALCWCNALLLLSRIFELGALLFHFALSPENAAASAACRHPSPPFTVLPEAWLSLPGSCPLGILFFFGDPGWPLSLVVLQNSRVYMQIGRNEFGNTNKQTGIKTEPIELYKVSCFLLPVMVVVQGTHWIFHIPTGPLEKWMSCLNGVHVVQIFNWLHVKGFRYWSIVN